MTRPSHWIIALGVHIYRSLLTIGPADFRREYEEQVVHVFRECCKDAYLRGGICGVISIWPSLFREAIIDMLVERFNKPVSSQENDGRMFYSIRHSMVTIFFAFVLFATAYVCLHSIAASQAPFSALIAVHSEIELAFVIIKYSTNVAFLAIALCGLPILFFLNKRVIAHSRSHQMLPFFTTVGQVLALFPTFIRIVISRLGYSIVVNVSASKTEDLIQSPLEFTLSFIFLADILLLIILVLFIGTASPAFVVPRRDFSMWLLHFARMPMIITTLAMAVAFVATVLWATRVVMVVPELPIYGTSTGILFLLVLAAMALSCSVSVHTMRGCINSCTSLTT